MNLGATRGSLIIILVSLQLGTILRLRGRKPPLLNMLIAGAFPVGSQLASSAASGLTLASMSGAV
jgi:hypothetical protein